MKFQARKSYGPKISLTDLQESRLVEKCNAGGLTCFVEPTHTGSCYISIGLPQWKRDIGGDLYNTLDCGDRDDVAKIRLSGHEAGRRADYTHNCVGGKTDCMAALRNWIDKIIAEHGPRGLAIVAKSPAA